MVEKLVSVIIPVFNGERYINQFIKSFRKQTKKNFELIFINDGSKDKSSELIEKYIYDESSFKIKLIKQENSGVSAARNKGLINSTGEYICFCDVDDEVTSSYIEDLYNVIETTNSDLVICKNYLKKNNILIPKYENSLNNQLIYSTHTNKECLEDFLYGRIVSGCWTTITRKEIINSNNLRFEEGVKYSEDLHMIWRMICLSNRITYLNKRLYIYILQPYSATSKFNEDRLQGYYLHKTLESFFKINAPFFYKQYKQFGAAKVLWSITWQASTNLTYRDFMLFCKKNSIKEQLLKLIWFKNLKVSLSTILLQISPFLFRIISIRIGKKFIH